MTRAGAKRSALVTGAAGFVGQWLCRALLAEGWDVVGAGVAAQPTGGILTRDEREAVRWVLADIRHQADVDRALAVAHPDVVFHLAGISFVPEAQSDPVFTHETNVLGAARLLHAVRVRRRAGELDPVVLVVGSAEQYGRAEVGNRRVETEPQAPVTVYAASKAAQEIVALEAFRSEGVRVVATRSFNHSGVGQADNFLLPALVRRARAIGDGGPASLRIGNTDTVRDFLHVRDVVRAYLLLAERGVPGEVYNVCSGIPRRVGDLAAQVLAAVGADASVEVDPALVRKVEIPWLVGDSAKLRDATGWSPALTCDDIIADLINATAR
ncbi:MAG: NAD-dependent epimerase/dehydratase family protein [Gemmatimonadaceae bacterium]|nr:NAD-dependent epimerase/dehydratase family protein [Gemmatimonadaceae bacterium]